MSKETRIRKEAVAAGHETTDLNARGVAWNGVALALIIALIFFALRGLLGVFDAQHPSSGKGEQTRAFGPEPRLQVDEARDLNRLREQENALLNSYGWVDQKAGIVRIPIARAMEIVAERGLSTDTNAVGKTRIEMRQEKAGAEKPKP